jgi:hypothetical protein
MPLSHAQQAKLSRFMVTHAYGKTAYDGTPFGDTHTEVQTFGGLEFVEENNRLEADITKTTGYQSYYSAHAPNHSVTKVELTMLAKALGIQFDPISNFHGKIIISDPFSVRLLQQAGVVTKKTKSESPSLSSNAPYRSIFSLSSSLLRPTPSVTVIKQIADDRDEIQQLEKAAEDLKIQIAEKKQQLKDKIKQHNVESIHVKFNEKPTIASEHRHLFKLYYTFRKLMKEKFGVEVDGMLDPLSPKIMKVRLAYTHEVPNEILSASRFLYSVCNSFEFIEGFTAYYAHVMNQEQLESSVTKLYSMQDLSAETLLKISNGPNAR